MKAILIINKPESCTSCPFSFFNRNWFCLITNKDIDISNKYHIPEWCPLKPMPKESIDMPNDEEYMKHYKRGRNDVIAEIKGEMMQIFCD